MNRFLQKAQTGLWLIDVQEKLFPHIDRSCEVLEKMCLALEAAQILQLPIFVSEQYPEGIGTTIAPLKKRLPKGQVLYSKTSFSGYHDPAIKKAVDQINVDTWILIGIEAHICILQTAKDLLHAGKQVVILNDAVSSRSLFDFSTAMGELRDAGARISSTETVVYELMRDSKSPEFKPILALLLKRTNQFYSR